MFFAVAHRLGLAWLAAKALYSAFISNLLYA